MEVFKNKFLVKLVASLCLFLTLFTFAGTTQVYAAEDDDEVWGGVLINPITKLLTAIGDSIMELLHDSIQSQEAAIIRVSGSTSWLEKIGAVVLGVVAGVLAAVAFIAAVVSIAGLAAYAAAAIAAGVASATFTVSISAGVVVAGAAAGICAGVAVKEAVIPNDIYLPAFSITAEEIFSNEIHLFDVNFFDPMADETVVKDTGIESVEEKFNANLTVYYDGSVIYGPTEISDEAAAYSLLIKETENYEVEELDGTKRNARVGELKEKISGHTDAANQLSAFNNIISVANTALASKGYSITDSSSTNISRNSDYTQGILETMVGTAATGPIDVKIILDVIHTTETITNKTTTTIVSTAKQLQGIVSTWYFIIRNVALLVLMLLLIYSGIRIVIGSTAGEKAKHKERIMDWLVAVCLIFVMHYIMVFAVEIVEKITELVGKTVNGNVAYIALDADQRANADEVLKYFDTTGDGNAIDEDYGEHGAVVWPTDLAGIFRIQSQLTDEGTSKWVGYSFCYVVLVLFTLFFAFTYAKRVLYMAFLTMIAPLVAMTYPIDKITDGKAQAFDAWLKEYIFNLMIQPLHLLLYTMLVSSAYTLASTSPVYALVAIGFMMPAEKLMRRFFGFEKAKTPGLLGGAAGAAIAMSGLQQILGGAKGGGGKGAGSNAGGKSKDQNKVKMARANGVDVLGTIAGGAPTGTGGNANPATRQPAGGNADPRQPAGGNADPRQPGGRPGQLSGGANNTGSDAGRANSNQSPRYDSRLTPEQRDELISEGIEPGNPEYDNWLRQYGIDPTETPYDSRLTPEQREEMISEGIEPGDPEYDNWLRQYGIEPDDSGGGSSDLIDPPGDEDSDTVDQPEDDVVENTDDTDDTDNTDNSVTLHEDGSVVPKRHIWRAVGAAALGGGKQLAVGALTGLHPLKFAGKVAAGAAAGAAGLALGVASGDPNKAFQYTTAGAMAGSALANSLSNTTLIDGSEIKDDVEEAYYGEDYEKELVRRQKEKFQKDKANLEYLRKTLKLKDTAEAKRVMETTGARCYDNGITDVEDIATIHKLTTERKDGNRPMSFEYAVAARNYAKKRLPGDTKSMHKDKIKNYQDTWKKEFEDKGYQNADKLSKDAWNAAVRFNQAKSGLTDL